MKWEEENQKQNLPSGSRKDKELPQLHDGAGWEPESSFRMQFSGRDAEKQQCRGFFQIRPCISKFLTSPCSGGIHMAGDTSPACSTPQWQEVAAFVQKPTSGRAVQMKWAVRNTNKHFCPVFSTGNNPEKHSRHSQGWERTHWKQDIFRAGRVPGRGSCWGYQVNVFYECSSWKTCFIFLPSSFMDFFFPWEISSMLQCAAQ